jgi:uncharacterized protein YcaQ
VQADPIRAPARAQDLTLRHRVKDYRAGDLESRYTRLAIEEDCLVNYGFLPREHLALMHPREAKRAWDADTRRKAIDVLAYVQAHGAVHPRQVELHFAHGRVQNYWGGSSNATTQLLDGMHYRGMLRVVRRDSGTRVYEAVAHAGPPTTAPPAARNAPPRSSNWWCANTRRCRPRASPTWCGCWATARRTCRRRRRRRCASRAKSWPAAASTAPPGTGPPTKTRPRAAMRPTTRCACSRPSIPVVWDRRRFELLWGWTYKFEAYTPAPKRQFGYYALPLLWHDRVIGWANVTAPGGRLQAEFGYVDKKPRDAAFRAALDDELQRMTQFLSGR